MLLLQTISINYFIWKMLKGYIVDSKRDIFLKIWLKWKVISWPVRCKGIIRFASSCEGETVCKLCNTNQLNPKRIQKVRKSVASLNIKCPLLRDCGWSGKLLEGEKHLKVCGSFLIRCPLGCDVVMKRYEMNNHLKTDSLNRETRCEFCDLSITYKNLTEHLLTCPAHSVVCECGRTIRRDKV